jgi:hypothetical protein
MERRQALLAALGLGYTKRGGEAAPDQP